MGIQFQSRSERATNQLNADIVAALNASQAVIEFDPSGTILAANRNFLATMGYTLEEVSGRHHRIFVAPEEASTSQYSEFWKKLSRGEFQSATFKRIGKGGKEVWIEATYNPLVGENGKVYKVIKFASDITANQIQAADARGQIAAVSRSQAVIEFDLQGNILTANENFCEALGYKLAEIKGQHHRMFVLPADAADPAYGRFWQSLARGEFHAAEYVRLGKGGREVWIQASYNAIFDAAGRPYKVVKYATDITARKAAVNELGAALGSLAEGRLDCTIDRSFPGELEAVRNAFNQTVARLDGIVRDLLSTTDALRSTTQEILSGANDLTSRTASQAGAIQATLSAVEQLTRTVVENGKRTDLARSNTRQVSTEAQGAGLVMGQANLAMDDVTAQSRQISKVIGMIDDIAFQTNLLALNASVEAARAGDAGKGFAVVAIEVRRLAQSAASASKEVKSLIEQSAEAVAKGSSLVASAGDSLNLMVRQVDESANLTEMIASSIVEQTQAINSVTAAASQIEKLTRDNVSLVNQTHAAIKKTEQQATRVDALVEMFVLDKALDQKGSASVNHRAPSILRAG